MGVVANLHIGPYAEFKVPEGRVSEFPPVGDDQSELCWEQLHINRGMEGSHTDCYRYAPRKIDSSPMSRQMYWNGKFLLVEDDMDLTDLDVRAEIAWFIKEFAEPLKRLEGCYGSSPAIRWGIVYWLT